MTVGVFVHIPRTGGTSIKAAMGVKRPRLRRHLDRYGPVITFGHRRLRDLHLPAESFAFAFCRNPYDWAVSIWALHEKSTNAGQSFPAFCANLDHWTWGQSLRIPQAERIAAGRLDFLGRFENLREDFDRLCDALGMERRTLSHLNAADRGPCSEHYNEEARDIIRAYYAQDFERFDYDADHLPGEEETS